MPRKRKSSKNKELSLLLIIILVAILVVAGSAAFMILPNFVKVWQPTTQNIRNANIPNNQPLECLHECEIDKAPPGEFQNHYGIHPDYAISHFIYDKKDDVFYYLSSSAAYLDKLNLKNCILASPGEDGLLEKIYENYSEDYVDNVVFYDEEKQIAYSIDDDNDINLIELKNKIAPFKKIGTSNYNTMGPYFWDQATEKGYFVQGTDLYKFDPATVQVTKLQEKFPYFLPGLPAGFYFYNPKDKTLYVLGFRETSGVFRENVIECKLQSGTLNCQDYGEKMSELMKPYDITSGVVAVDTDTGIGYITTHHASTEYLKSYDPSKPRGYRIKSIGQYALAAYNNIWTYDKNHKIFFSVSLDSSGGVFLRSYNPTGDKGVVNYGGVDNDGCLYNCKLIKGDDKSFEEYFPVLPPIKNLQTTGLAFYFTRDEETGKFYYIGETYKDSYTHFYEYDPKKCITEKSIKKFYTYQKDLLPTFKTYFDAGNGILYLITGTDVYKINLRDKKNPVTVIGTSPHPFFGISGFYNGKGFLMGTSSFYTPDNKIWSFDSNTGQITELQQSFPEEIIRSNSLHPNFVTSDGTFYVLAWTDKNNEVQGEVITCNLGNIINLDCKKTGEVINWNNIDNLHFMSNAHWDKKRNVAYIFLTYDDDQKTITEVYTYDLNKQPGFRMERIHYSKGQSYNPGIRKLVKNEKKDIFFTLWDDRLKTLTPL
jgi:hypothetical protein